MRSKLQGNLFLLIAAIIWGTAFVAQSEGMNYVEPFTYNAARTLLGGFTLLPVLAIFRRNKNIKENNNDTAPAKISIKGGIFCGLFLFIASSFQQWGISMTTAGKAGFITALYIIIVPLIELIIYKRSSFIVWICAAIAAVGFWLLCIKDGFILNKGDGLVLCCTFFFALHIMTVDYFCAKKCDGLIMSCVQFFTAGILMTICMFIFEKPDINCILNAKYTILYAGIMSSGVAYTLQILGQKSTDPTSATLIMSLESVFAALSGWLIIHEVLSFKELLGCTLVFAAVILVQMQQPISNCIKKCRNAVDNNKTEDVK